MKLFISPHNDDETLFGAFTILREKPAVLIVTDSKRQAPKGITSVERKRESMEALAILGAPEVHFLGIPDELLSAETFIPAMNQFFKSRGHFAPTEHVFAPAFEDKGNCDHNLIATAIVQVLEQMPIKIPMTHYLTYTTEGKSRSQQGVPFERDWPLTKMKALACYRSQILEISTRDHFLREQYEYYAA